MPHVLCNLEKCSLDVLRADFKEWQLSEEVLYTLPCADLDGQLLTWLVELRGVPDEVPVGIPVGMEALCASLEERGFVQCA